MPGFTYNCIEKIITIAKIKKYYQLSPAEIKKVYDKKFRNQKPDPIKSVTKTLNVEKESILSQCCYKVSPKDTAQSDISQENGKQVNSKRADITTSSRTTNKAVLFIHGGGYIMEINNLHWNAIKRIAEEKQATVYVPIYPLAPDHDWKPSFAMIKELYLQMLKLYAPEEITIIGDSAGAQMALSFCQQCLEEQMPQPAKMILVSPPIDYAPDKVTMQRYNELDRVDPMIATGIIPFVKEFWAIDTDMKDYHISPIYGKFKGLAPMEVFCGTKEIPYATVEELKEKVLEAEGKIKLHIGQDMIHIWPYFLWSKESKSSMAELLSLI